MARRTQNDWHGLVYKPPENDMVENWDEIRDAIITRDNYTCLRCECKRRKNDLSVHHLMPRSKGGSNEPQNLVTLCNDCHDYVEVEGLETKADIVGSYEDAPVKKPKEKKYKNRKETFERPTWHEIVYGGAKRNF